MNYPLITEYIEAIKSAEDNFEGLSFLRPVLGDDGLPVMTSGNFAVVFKMQDIETGKFYALKCFTKEQEGRSEAYHQIADALKDVDSSYLVSLRYLDKELFVDTDQTADTEFPVLLMDWVEGKTLDKYLRENLDDKYALEMLAYRFSKLAQWIIPQPFAHGDLKPDNILVREDGSLVLVDYDGMYVPAMKGEKARELGSPDFRHPQRTENDFDEHIDEFPLVSILISLTAISHDAQLMGRYGSPDRLLLSMNDYITIDSSKSISKCKVFTDDSFKIYHCKFYHLISTFYIFFITQGKGLKWTDLSLPYPTPRKNRITCLNSNDRSAIYTEKCIIGDAVYTDNETRLIHFNDPANIFGVNINKPANKYNIKSSTITICDKAFSDSFSLRFLGIPDSVKYIGSKAFYNSYIKYIDLPLVDFISKDAFDGCCHLHTIAIPKGSFAFFAKMLPNNINQLKEIQKDDCIRRIKSYLNLYGAKSPIKLVHLLVHSISNLNYFMGTNSRGYRCDIYNDGRSCDISFLDSDAHDEDELVCYCINNIEDLDELCNTFYCMLLDSGLFNRVDSSNDICGKRI